MSDPVEQGEQGYTRPLDERELERRRERARWVLDTTRMAKSGYAPLKATLAEWYLEDTDALVSDPVEQGEQVDVADYENRVVGLAAKAAQLEDQLAASAQRRIAIEVDRDSLLERVRLLEQERDGFKRLFESAQDASEAAEQREKKIMRDCLKAEKFDAQYENSRLPGDSALSALFLSFEEALAADRAGEPKDD